MAKKRKEKTEQEEDDFKLPKFDEEKFLKKERRNIRTLFISFFFGVLIALISFGFWALLSGSMFRWELVLLLGVFNMSWLKYIFIKLKIDLTDFGRKGWFGSLGTYIFTWLLVLIVLVNPPFYDNEPPRIELVVLPEMQELNGTIEIVAQIIDNVEVQSQDITCMLHYPDGANTSIENFEFEDTFFTYTFENPDNLTGEFIITLSAKDVNGHQKNVEKQFSYSNETIRLSEPLGALEEPGPEVAFTTSITFVNGTEVSRLYYTINEGDQINATVSDEYYRSSPKQKGWPKNENVTMRVSAEVIYYFKNFEREFNNTIVDTTPYYFTTSDDPNIGTENSPEITLPKARYVQVPGFELLILLASMLIVLVLTKRKRKKNQS